MEGLSQLLILLIFAAIAVLEGAGRRRKAGPPRPRPPAEPSPPARRETGASRRASPPVGGTGEGEPRSSEGVLPEELWEELLGLPPRRRTPPPEVATGGREGGGRGETPEGKEETPPIEARSLEEEPFPPPEARPLGGKPEHGRERGVMGPWVQPDPLAGTAPVSLEETPRRMASLTAGSGTRAPFAPPSPPSFPTGVGPERATPRARLFGDGGGADLRRAVLLREVLGPPLALREEGEGEGFPRI